MLPEAKLIFSIRIAEIFCDLPDRTDFSDYYETIPEPECLNNVAVSYEDNCGVAHSAADIVANAL